MVLGGAFKKTFWNERIISWAGSLTAKGFVIAQKQGVQDYCATPFNELTGKSSLREFRVLLFSHFLLSIM